MRALAALIRRSRTETQRLRLLAVDRDEVADAAVVRLVHEVAEIAGQLPVFVEAPVVEDPKHVPVDRRRPLFVDDERTVEPARNLLVATLVRVVPEGPRVV